MPFTVIVHFETEEPGVYGRSDQIFETYEEAQRYGNTQTREWNIDEMRVIECCVCGADVEEGEGECLECREERLRLEV